eukprot:gene6631-22998_t
MGASAMRCPCGRVDGAAPGRAGGRGAAAGASGAELYPVPPGRSCEKYTVRHLTRSDYHRGFLELLSQLTTVGDVTAEEFGRRFDEIEQSRATHNVVVIEDVSTSRVVAAGSVVIELKFIHGCGRVGHIEDIVTSSKCR